MRRAVLVAALLALCGCDDTQKSQVMAACKMKAMEAIGPAPPPCAIHWTKSSDYPADVYATCVSEAREKIEAWEYKNGPYVENCMKVAGYRPATLCIGDWMGLGGDWDHCYERRSAWRDWLYSLVWG